MKVGCGGVILAFVFVFAFLNDCARYTGADSPVLSFCMILGIIILIWVVVQFFRT